MNRNVPGAKAKSSTQSQTEIVMEYPAKMPIGFRKKIGAIPVSVAFLLLFGICESFCYFALQCNFLDRISKYQILNRSISSNFEFLSHAKNQPRQCSSIAAVSSVCRLLLFCFIVWTSRLKLYRKTIDHHRILHGIFPGESPSTIEIDG